MENKPIRPGYAALRRFRESKPDALYFITFNLSVRGYGLESSVLTGSAVEEWTEIESSGAWTVRSAVVMPDHVHLLVEMNESGSLPACLRRFKGRLSRELREHGLNWQKGYYEHQMREGEELLPVFLYIYLNPYRAGLLPEAGVWAGYYCSENDWNWFGPLTKERTPQPEWLR